MCSYEKVQFRSFSQRRKLEKAEIHSIVLEVAFLVVVISSILLDVCEGESE
jgi:hypothetical protein